MSPDETRRKRLDALRGGRRCRVNSPGIRFVETRWQCQCGRFVAEAAITTEDYTDPGAYYGVSTRWSYACSGCGVVHRAPRLVSWDAGWMEADDAE